MSLRTLYFWRDSQDPDVVIFGDKVIMEDRFYALATIPIDAVEDLFGLEVASSVRDLGVGEVKKVEITVERCY